LAPDWVGKKPEKKPWPVVGWQAVDQSPATTLWFLG
jgi:hypothetical protein